MTEDRSDLAAEYALGVLADDDLRQAIELDRTDRSFRAEVAFWLGVFASLVDEIEPVKPPANAWMAIEQQIGQPERGPEIMHLERRLGRWRAVAAAMTAIAASLAVFIVLRPASQTPSAPPAPRQVSTTAPAPLAAALADPQKATRVVATWNAASRQLVLVVAQDLPAEANRSRQLWVIPSDGTPRSLGLIEADRQSHIELAETLATLLEQGATVAISVEPQGGSPTGAPTGPIIASGELKRA